MSFPGGYSAEESGVSGSGFTIVSTFPLRIPRIVRDWFSTETTRYFSSKIAPLVVFMIGLDAEFLYGDSWVFSRFPSAILNPSAGQREPFSKSLVPAYNLGLLL